MKTIKITQIFTMLVAVALLVACVQDDDFSVPELDNEVTGIDGQLVALSSIAGLVAQEGGPITFETPGQYVEGYVISSDEAGNFFEEFIIQDSPENPTTAIRVLIDVNPLFTTYEFGRKVFIRLDRLTAGESNGVLTMSLLGVNNEAVKIPATLQDEIIVRSSEVAEIVPVEVSISDFSEDLENIYIRLVDMQFIKEEVVDQSLTYAAEELDQFDGERTLFSCATGQTAIFSTSTFADFKALSLPAGRGTIDGILTRNFFGDTFNVVVNDPSSIDFSQEDRCDPVEIDCGVASSAGATVLFEDFFETQSTNQPISGNGWTNFQQEGTETWEAFSSTGQNASLGISARVGSFMSGDASTIAWLVTPQLDLDAQDGETLQFMTSNSFSDGSTLELLFSSDWDGVPENIPSATWDAIPAGIIVDDADFFGDWIDSGIVDLSCIEGSGYIAFRYIGSGTGDFDGTYELDEIQINAQ
ncbi:hypothetical protein GCM10011344_15470 [Dokdonia pacifica]|uniref:DUF5689 domain-containing protein n=1 Tax=Dokdonia pacifica TaxID=1627892 RepID=A0A238W3M9_9FLAO|nr:DUF5689 domain-containing protein [Dokdonia pacifica]GGG15785.1 hypothetical protein GCM10011344_15470 [Dokdonia pacifica]SNR40319.1 hypothetical protein SAMN06265376_101596 [Dokdonia pacifica]